MILMCMIIIVCNVCVLLLAIINKLSNEDLILWMIMCSNV